MKKLGFLLGCLVLLGIASCQKEGVFPRVNDVIDGDSIENNDTTIIINGKDYNVNKEFIENYLNSLNITDPNRDSDFFRKKGKR